MSKQIPISQGLHVIIDDEDFDRVNQFRWTAAVRKNTTYAYRTFGPKISRGQVYLHRYLLEPGPDECVDHKNGNGLDNRRCNLRLATQAQNQFNRGMHPKNKSGFKGVCWCAALEKWHAQIRDNYAQRHLGYFDDIIEAAEAYKRAALHLRGEFAERVQ